MSFFDSLMKAVQTGTDRLSQQMERIDQRKQSFEKYSDAQLVAMAKRGGLNTIDAAALKKLMMERGLL